MNIQLDSLTKLPVKRSYLQLVQQVLQGKNKGYCMLTMKIDHFNYLSKWYGVAEEERILTQVAGFYQSLSKNPDLIAGYMEPDTFSCFFPSDLDAAEHIRHGIFQVLQNAKDSEIFRPLFGGFILKHGFQTDAVDLFGYTTNAIQQAVGALDTNIFWFDEDLAKQLVEEMELMPKITYGMENAQFTFYLQPKCQICDGRIVGAEALMRWIGSTGEIISPDNFIPAMEKNGYIIQLDKFIWEKACQLLQRWQLQGKKLLPISVNISRRDIQELDVVAIFRQLLEKYKTPVEYLELEITESAYIENELSIMETERELRKLGFKILIDDFGSGYSSLNMLKDIQADVLKLDMRFLDMQEENFDKGRNIINSVISMANQIGMSVIAEGVETLEQGEMLADLGCNFAQGYYYYRPMPISEFEILVADDDNVAPAEIAARKSGAAYVRDLEQYFAMVAEVNPFTGEYHFFHCDDVFRRFSKIRCNTITEHIAECIRRGYIHPDDVLGYLRRTSLSFIKEKLLSKTLRVLYEVRIKKKSKYCWYAFECLQPKNFSVEDPWVLFTWKQAHVDASRHIDALTLMHKIFFLAVKINVATGRYETLHREHTAAIDICKCCSDAAELHQAFKEKFLPEEDWAAYDKATNSQVLLKHFAHSEEPVRVKIHYNRRGRYVPCWLEIFRSIEYIERKPVLLVTVMENVG